MCWQDAPHTPELVISCAVMCGQGNLSVRTVVHKSEGNVLVSRLYPHGEPQHILVEMNFDILRGDRCGP